MSNTLNITEPPKDKDAANEARASEKRLHTAGEKTFIGLVYGGINWIVNTGLSAFISLKVNDSTWGRSAVDNIAKGLTILPKIVRTSNPPKLAKTIFNTLTLFTGGTLLVIPFVIWKAKKTA